MKLVRLFFLLLIYLRSFFISANVVQIEIDPKQPVKGESFNIRFKIQTKSQERPFISFDPKGLEVLSRKNEGVSIQTMIINGKFSSKREMVFSYEVMPTNSSNVSLRNIKVEIEGNSFKHRNIQIKVLSKRLDPRNVFIEATVSKNKVFLGEGIDLRYYLYYKVPILSIDVKKFPTLNKMIKRFHNIKGEEETVNYGGVVYRRILKYSARVYPEKIGKVYIDPLRLKVQFQKRGRQSPFGSFGFALGRVTSKDFSSKRLTVNVKSLPAVNVPKNFTGLVGKHNFSIKQSKNKFLVNEAVEIRLEISGEGALENMEGPVIYNTEALETFDTKSEIVETGKSSAKKIFDYTYLTRSSINMKEKEVTLSYFDPEGLEYIEKSLKLPGMKIEGLAGQNVDRKSNEKVEDISNQSKVKIEKRNLVAPLFENYHTKIGILNLIKYLPLMLLSFLIGQIFLLFFNFKKKKSDNLFTAKSIIKDINKNGINYSRLYTLIILLPGETIDIVTTLKESSLKKEVRDYFINLIGSLENKNFSHKARKQRIIIKKKFFKEFLKEIK